VKIFAVVDIHGNRKIIKQIGAAVKKKKPALIICAGDHTYFGADEKEILESLDFGIPVLLLPGNHEVPEATKKIVKNMKHILWLHQGAYEQDGILFLGYGDGGLPCCGGLTEFGKCEEFLRKQIKAHKGKVVLITHEPPLDTAADEVEPGKHVGSKDLREFIKESQPRLHICGHIHPGAGTISKIGNTSVIHPGPHGRFIEL
jgi:uncharacterized protein